MAELPGSGYLSLGTRTEAEMQVALEQLHDVIAEIGSKEVTTLTINGSGAITTPLSSMVSVAPAGAGIADDLVTIAVSNITRGRMVILQHDQSTTTEANGITVKHGTGAGRVEMRDSSDFILCAKRMLGLIYTGSTGHWKEVWRGYGRDTVAELLAERVDLGLGNASVEAIGTNGAVNGKVLKAGAALVANDVLKLNASGQIIKATVTDLGGGNATTLDNLDSTDFIKTAPVAAAAQTITSDLTVTAAGASSLIVNSASGASTTALRLKASGDERAFVEMVTSDGELEVGTRTAGGVQTETIRLNPGGANDEKFEFAVDGTTWQSLTPGAGNGLNADLLDGLEGAFLTNISSIAHTATAGSFRFSDGTTELLVQWGGTWTNTGSKVRLTFPIAYASTPHIIGGGYMLSYSSGTDKYSTGYNQPELVNSTYMQIPKSSSSGSQPTTYYTYSRVGNYIAIGLPV